MSEELKPEKQENAEELNKKESEDNKDDKAVKEEQKEEKNENENQDNKPDIKEKETKEDDKDNKDNKEEDKDLKEAENMLKEKKENDEKADNVEEEEKDEEIKEEEIQLPPEEVEKINNDIIEARKKAGELYKASNYIEALNIYSIHLDDAKRAKLNDQLVILYCNQGICFNKLKDKDKALEAFSNALKINDKYSKALANRMLLYNSKEDYLEALEDYNKLKEIDRNLWNNYAYMESELQMRAEIKKKQMTDEMLGKLKDIGNSILGNFGISLDNFKMTPNGQGGYSIQYQNQNS